LRATTRDLEDSGRRVKLAPQPPVRSGAKNSYRTRESVADRSALSTAPSLARRLDPHPEQIHL